MTKNDDELAELKAAQAQMAARIAELEAKEKPPKSLAELDREAALWRDEMHQASEARMSRFSNFSREQLRAFEAATPPDTCRDLVQHGTVQSPSAAGTSGVITSVSRNPGFGGNGWREATPLGPQPGIGLIDDGVNAALPHGPEWGKKEKGNG
jgi:hypothetical protein